jgi:hypothetical protein
MRRGAAVVLPAVDAELERLPPEERARIGYLWSRRAQNERASSGVFQWVTEALRDEGFDASLVALATRAISDELLHHDVCNEVAQRYAAGGVSAPIVATPPEPGFGTCSRRQARVLAITLQCAVNESLSAAYLGVCLEQVQSSVARAGLQRLLQDEVDHARIGWALLASPQLETSERARLSRHLPLLLDLSLSAWLAADADYPEDLPTGHGVVSCKAIQASTVASIRDVLLPGFAHVGLDVSFAQAYFSAHPQLRA